MSSRRTSGAPSRLARFLLRMRLPKDLVEPILGDLEERYRDIADRDPRLARSFYWRQTFAALKPQLRPHPETDDDALTPRRMMRRRAPFFEAWLQDLRYGARRLIKSPGFTATAGLTLALGIGASATIFSVVHATLLRSLPFAEPEQLVMVWSRATQEAGNRYFSPADFFDLQQRSQTLAEVAVVTETVIGPMTEAGEPRHVKISRTTQNFFKMLGVEPMLGRGFRPEDGLPIADDAEPPPLPVLLSHDAWQRHFGGDREVLGRTMRVFGRPAEVIGVMPSHFEMYLPAAAEIGHDIDLFWPLRSDFSEASRTGHYLRVVARLAPDASLAEAAAESATIAAQLRSEHVYHLDRGLEIDVVPLADDAVAHIRPTLMFLAGAVGFVMLIACANVANLLLARVSRRRREIAVMAALGAGRWRLTRQLLIESLLLAAVGILGGLLLTSLGIATLKTVGPDAMPWLDDIQVEPAVVAFTVAASLLAVLVYGLAPALLSGAGGLKTRAAHGSTRQSRLRGMLVVGEVALSLVLLIGAGLMVRTVGNLANVELGFDPHNLLAVDVAMPTALDSEQRLQVVEEIERELTAIPGVEAAGGIFPVPLNGVYVRTCSYSPNAPPEESRRRGEAYFRIVTPDYFDAARVSLVAGRQLEPSDNDGEPAVVVIEERLAQRTWPGQDPVGRRLFFQVGSREPIEATVAGVVENVRQGSLVDDRPTLYMPRHFYPALEMGFVVRTAADPEAVIAPIRRVIGGLDVEMPAEIRTMEANIDRALLPTHFVLSMMTAFSGLALVLAAVGLYGVLAYSVSQRTREIGVRVAMGATHRDILRLVLGEGSRLALAGTAVGLAAAIALTRFMEHHLYGVTPTDPRAFGLTASLLIAVALAASWVPARRAARVMPNVALRNE